MSVYERFVVLSITSRRLCKLRTTFYNQRTIYSKNAQTYFKGILLRALSVISAVKNHLDVSKLRCIM
jgi:hypothetical protein